MKIFFIGIGGIGMSALAEYLLEQGNIICGSDFQVSAIVNRLVSKGATIKIGHNERNITDDIDLVVYSSAIGDSNPEILQAKAKSIKIIRRAELLGSIVNNMFLIAVSGTHGKTTTAAMIAKLLIDFNLDPTVFVGGSMDFLDGAAMRRGAGKIAVVEADEYDRSFLTLSPDITIINNIEEDHLDIYKDLNDIKDNFIKFTNQSKKGSIAILNGDDENIASIIPYLKSENIIKFGLSNLNNIYASKIQYYLNEIYSSAYTIIDNGNEAGRVLLKLNGEHNIKNSLAAYSVGKYFNIPFKQFKKSIGQFKPVKRRMELVYNKEIRVYDDYAHHPTEIKSSIEGLRKISKGKIITVFQPHLYTRTRDFYREFAKSLSLSDKLILLDIYPAREEKIEGIFSEIIAKEYKIISGKDAIMENDSNKINLYLKQNTDFGDIVIFQGAGSITLYCRDFVKSLNKDI